MDHKQARVCARILKAIGHPLRIQILETLMDGEKCVCELLKLSSVNQSTVSRHLAYMKRAGILADRPEGTRVMYRLTMPKVVSILKAATRAAQAAARSHAR